LNKNTKKDGEATMDLGKKKKAKKEKSPRRGRD